MTKVKAGYLGAGKVTLEKLPLERLEVGRDILLSRALNDLDKLKQHVDVGKGGRKTTAGGGRKPTCPEIGAALFAWFIDMRVGLKTHKHNIFQCNVPSTS